MPYSIFTLLMVFAFNAAYAADFDVLIRNGTVYDGTGVFQHAKSCPSVTAQGWQGLSEYVVFEDVVKRM